MNPRSLLCLPLLLGIVTGQQLREPTASPEPRPIDLVICLDTSGSMQGLINAARESVWAIVNDLAMAKPTPKLRLALLSYGNQGHQPEAGWVEVLTPFTDDLDAVSQKLFALTTNGGEEYVGRVLQASLDQLQWSEAANALKLIVVAGNEAADQDQHVDFRVQCQRAIQKGVLVNAVYCGNPADPIVSVWREVATLADGQFAAIDHDQGGVVIETQFDAQIMALSAQLNETYLPLGQSGVAAGANQAEQDRNAAGLNSQVAAQRALTKCTSGYSCSWDLVDQCKDGKTKLEDVKEADLPEPMRKMTLEQRKQHVAAMTTKRAAVQQQIVEITGKRDAVVAAEMKKRALDASKTFDHAVRAAVRAQAKARGFESTSPAQER